jgi:endonuclease III
MPGLKNLIARLQKRYGAPDPPPAHGPFELVVWENAVYLMPDDRRAEVFEALRRQVGLTPDAIFKTPQSVLLPLAERGGMRPESRVFRWHEIARIAREQFGGNLDQILEWPYPKAKKALKLFPTIGDPGAEKILMFCGLTQGLPLESNALRVLVRIGYGRLHLKNYGAMYRSVQEAIAPELPKSAAAVTEAHLLLRKHGKSLCRDATPQCFDCPLENMCAFASKHSP